MIKALLVAVLALVALDAHASITFFWRAENSTTLDGTDDFSAGDTTATANNSPSFDAAAAKIGSFGILINGVSERYDFAPTSIIAPAAGSIAMWVQFTSATAGDTFFFSRGAASTNDNIALVIGAGNDEANLQIRNATSGLVELTTSAANMTGGNWYFIVGQWDESASDRRIAVYNSTGTLLSENVDTTTAFTAPAALDSANGIRFGDNNGFGGSRTYYIDNMFLGSAYADGPIFVSNRDITSYTSYSAGGGTVVNPISGRGGAAAHPITH